MIKREYYMTRNDGVNIFRIYSDVTPVIKQHPTEVMYDCWVYKRDSQGRATKEVDWEKSGVFDVENATYIYEEILMTEEELEKFRHQHVSGDISEYDDYDYDYYYGYEGDHE